VVVGRESALMFSPMLKGGSKRFMTIESKSFDFGIVGAKEDFLRIVRMGEGGDFCSCCLR